MPRQIALLRGVNVGAANRIAMPALREALTEDGFENVLTYVQSGNIVLDSALDDRELAAAIERLIAGRFDLSVPAVVRNAERLAEVVDGNPFPQAALADPRRLQVTFLSERLPDDAAERVLAVSSDAFASDVEAISLAESRCEVYGWHPAGIHVSKLARELSDRRLGVTATARNWTTVTRLLELAASDPG
jgi:uncharacterized protein (DUF1697 family)